MRAAQQFLRFALVGLSSNVILFAAYLLLTRLGMGHKIAMSVLYLIGVMQTFFANRSWSFSYRGPARMAMVRYVLIYALGYAVNLLSLVVFVDWLDFPHKWIQGLTIFILAGVLFFAQRLWVFPLMKTPQLSGTLRGERSGCASRSR
jgi:putative flippase GtrA